ncbi:MAG TPA: peptidylprolyl isomerase [Hanamia sp.]|nr:peptidylprolyl isomerase [Hanamia sp.]
MKKLFLLCLFVSFIFISYGQTLFSYGNHKVSATEFLNAYNKNKTSDTVSSQGLRNYLDLYIKFKLKVQAAKDMHLDTLPSLKADLENFRSQVQNNYLKDQDEINRLTNEAFERSQKDIHAVYYFVPEVSDSSLSHKVISEVYKLLRSNTSDSEILAQVNKSRPNVQKADLGFITVFSLPYEFENIVYELKPGQSATPFETKRGWYIFKNVGDRHAVGKITLAQILFAVPDGFIIPRQKTKKLADSVYNALMNGADFAKMAKQFSDDRSTYMNGGLMPEFGTAKYDSVFEDHAFALTKDGEISQPFETKFGFHIIKRISVSPVPETKNDKPFMTNLEQEVLHDSRINIAKQKFISEILPKIGFKKMTVNKENLWQVSDSSLITNKNVTVGNINENTILFTFNNHANVKVRDWNLYLRNSNKTVPGGNHESYKTLYPEFVDASVVANYASRLQNFSLAFKNQIQEFKEGNMLFEVMQRNVWGKASTDSIGLLRYYQQHKEKYFWRSSAEAVIFSCSNKEVASESIKQLRKRKTWREIIIENPTHVQADSGRYELGQIPVVGRTHFTVGLITLPVINKTDGTAVFAKIIKLYPDHEQRDFEDARGLVINDYQNFLEQKWVAQLEKKYPVKENEKVFQELTK